MSGNIEVGKRIKELREMRNLSREILAERTQISSKFLYEIETGRKGFSAETLCKLARELSVSCDCIMGGKASDCKSRQDIMSVLDTLEPMQVYRIRNILQILCKITEEMT